MHLASRRAQTAWIGELDTAFEFEAGETIWTESSHKFVPSELAELAAVSGFDSLRVWTDRTWPFSEVLWRVK